MKVRSPFAASFATAVAMTLAASAFAVGAGVSFFRSSAAVAAPLSEGITSVEAALGVAPKPLSLAAITVRSATDLTASLKVTGSSAVSAKSLPYVALKGAPSTKKAHKVSRARRTISTRTVARRTTRVTKRVKVAKRSRRARPTTVSRGSGSWRTAQCSTYGIGDGLVGHGMAGGGTLHSDSMVVAHKSLPFGTRIQFSYNGHVCIAVVEDRGPYVSGRDFDLGPGTARSLHFSGVDYLRWRIVK